jgi:hypothetical protein
MRFVHRTELLAHRRYAQPFKERLALFTIRIGFQPRNDCLLGEIGS